MKTINDLWLWAKRLTSVVQDWIEGTQTSNITIPVEPPDSTHITASPEQSSEINPGGICEQITTLRDELNDNKLNKFEQDHLAERLQTLSSLVAEQAYRKSSTIELHQSFNAAEIEHRLASDLEKSSHIAILEVLRNVLVLLPILLTWMALAIASNNYAAALNDAPELFETPFLLLWQNNFDGLGSGSIIANWRPTFSDVAYLDAAIIAFAVILTAYFHWRTDFSQSAANAAAAKIRGRLETILWATSHLFSSAYIKQVSNTASLDSYTDVLTAGTEKLGAAAVQIGNASTRLREFEDIASRIQHEQSTLSETVQDLAKEVRTLGIAAETSLHNATSTTTVAQELAGMTEGLLNNFEVVTDNLKADRDENRSFAAQMRQVAGSLKENAVSTEESFTVLAKDVADNLQASIVGIEETAGNLGDKVHAVLNESNWKLEETTRHLGDRMDGVQKELEALASKGYSLPQAQPRVGILLVIFGVFQILMMGAIVWLMQNHQIVIKFV